MGNRMAGGDKGGWVTVWLNTSDPSRLSQPERAPTASASRIQNTYDFHDAFIILHPVTAYADKAKKEQRHGRVPLWCKLKKADASLFAGFHGLMIPNAGLDFANVGAAHHQHGKAGLADTAADGQGQCVVQKPLGEGQFPTVIAARFLQLTVRDSASTRIPMEEISKARSRTSSQKKISQFKFQSS